MRAISPNIIKIKNKKNTFLILVSMDLKDSNFILETSKIHDNKMIIQKN